MTATAEKVVPRIYVGTYQKYSGGSIAGAWIDLSEFDSYEELEQRCKELHADELDPEYMVQDFEGYPKAMYHESGLPTEEEFSFIKELAELDSDEYEAYSEYAGHMGNLPTVEDFREAYQGETSEREFAVQLADELGYYDAMKKAGINAAYFDDEAFARDLFCGDYFSTGGYIFRNS